MNMLATVADLFFILHDWVFTEQIFHASLTIPIVICLYKDVQRLQADAKVAMKIRYAVNITFYLLTLTWFLISLINGKFIWRMAVSTLFFIEGLVFLVSLMLIRGYIQKVNSRKQFKPNNCLMYVNLLMIGLEWFFF